MSKNGMNFTALVDALVDEMRAFGAASAELSADILELGVRVTVKVKEITDM